ncbi:REP element-mobilizing transposase RayT [Muriicola jejuensis]|uniref:Transposase n=1 Tax=Muriicola jejuensis TaxID=504488 RepID=A0A6P0U8H9_9FLAO|nr:transposase [Muriicola jejuensis]NER09447.1 transposase [Muriicola jejuensis]SMP08588.1 REP element-mobilizing transposase RayT [Muriicola jejuensis]
MSRNYKFHNPKAAYFVSFATVYWIDVFTRQPYFQILAEAITYCRKEKGMELFAYCFMPNHVHFIFRSFNGDPASLLRDFKKYTSKRIVTAIRENFRESRREWLLEMFGNAASKKKNVKNYQLWQHHNKPVELWSAKVIKQKLDYIHKNPIRSGFVVHPEEWKFSSARNLQGDHSVMEIDDIGFLG